MSICHKKTHILKAIKEIKWKRHTIQKKYQNKEYQIRKDYHLIDNERKQTNKYQSMCCNPSSLSFSWEFKNIIFFQEK